MVDLHTGAVYEYISPLSQPWSNAIDRLFNPAMRDPIPLDHPRKDILRLVREQLRAGQMINDMIVWAYSRILCDMPMSVASSFLDTLALQSLRNQRIMSQNLSPRIRDMKPRVGSGESLKYFWPIHHEGYPHWSLVYVDIQRRTVTSYDSYNSLGAKMTLQAKREILKYWKDIQLGQASSDKEWKEEQSSWDAFDVIQAQDSNDCGILMLLLMRLLRTETHLPVLCKEKNVRRSIMAILGLRMRYIIAAELVADKANPPNELIPAWLQSS